MMIINNIIIYLRNSSKSENPLEKRVPFFYSGAYNDIVFLLI